VTTRIQIRRDAASSWTAANPVLAAGEIGYETDTRALKIGNGSTAWNSLLYGPTKFSDFIDITVSESTPTTPAANIVRLFSRNIANKILPAFVGPSGIDTALQVSISRNKISYISAVGNSVTVTAIGDATPTAVGTATAATVSTSNIYTRNRKVEYLVTTAATTAVAGWHGPANQYTLGGTSPYGGFFYVCRFGPSTGVTTATRRLFVGMSNSVAAPTDVNPSTLTNMFGVGYDAADTNMQFMHNDGSGTATKIDLGESFPRPSTDRNKMYELALFAAPFGGSTLNYQVTDLGTNSSVVGSVSTDLPTTAALLSPRGYSSVGGTSSVTGIALSSQYIETDF
jgi:hypothetical protein